MIEKNSKHNVTLRKDVGSRLKQSRKDSGMTQQYVAELLGMTQQQYSRFENGVFELNYTQIKRLCELYDISADFLFDTEKGIY